MVVGFGAFGLILFMVRTKTGFAHFDVSATRFGAQHATALSTSVLRWFTQLGGAVVLVPLALMVAVVEGRRGRPFSVVAFLTVTVGGQFLVADLIKWGVDRVRPNLDRLTGFGGSSFPSGHATAAAADLRSVRFARRAAPLGRDTGTVGRRCCRPGGVDRVVPRHARRALDDGCAGWPGSRMGLVRVMLHRLRWATAGLWGAGRGRPASRTRFEHSHGGGPLEDGG